MPNHVALNNVEHRNLRIDTRHDATLGDEVMFALTFPAEFRNVQAHYPIVFRRGADDTMQPVALFGFSEGSNLFLDGGRWNATYVPLAIQRQPFLIGRDGESLTVHIDLDHPRAKGGQGEALFREHGGTSEYLERITSVLLALHDGMREAPAFVQALRHHELLESFALDVELEGGSVHRLTGFHTINEERLRALDAAALDALHRAGHLEPVFMAVASISRFRDLIERTNRRRHAAER